MNNERLIGISDLLAQYLLGCEKEEVPGQVALHDPVANRIIGSHYSLSHYFGALCLQAHINSEETLRDKASKILAYIRTTHNKFSIMPDYHFDFNNFIWAMLLKLNQEFDGLISENIQEDCRHLLLHTGDSRHGTTNWLPMRAFNNAVRYELTGLRKYAKTRDKLLKQVYRVLDVDGMFEDNIIKGKSANPQYHVYTLTGLLLGMRFGCWDSESIDLKRSVSFFLKHIAPDGDFNYYGRGTNQIFGWGPALMLLRNTVGVSEYYDRCTAYVLRHLPTCLAKDGLLLENSISHQQLQWRFYHYATVYIAHFYFWISLARLSTLMPLTVVRPSDFIAKNVHVVEEGLLHAVVFKGMKSYLQERGPSICGIWSESHGCLFKGPFGPFFECPPDHYEHIAPSCAITNHMGMLLDQGDRRRFTLRQTPLFPEDISITAANNQLHFSMQYSLLPTGAKFVVPVFSQLRFTEADVNQIFHISVDGQHSSLWKYGTAIGPYHELDLYCTRPSLRTRKVMLSVREPTLVFVT